MKELRYANISDYEMNTRMSRANVQSFLTLMHPLKKATNIPKDKRLSFVAYVLSLPIRTFGSKKVKKLCFLNVNTAAEHTGLSVSSVKRLVSYLVKAKVLTETKHPDVFKSNAILLERLNKKLPERERADFYNIVVKYSLKNVIDGSFRLKYVEMVLRYFIFVDYDEPFHWTGISKLRACGVTSQELNEFLDIHGLAMISGERDFWKTEVLEEDRMNSKARLGTFIVKLGFFLGHFNELIQESDTINKNDKVVIKRNLLTSTTDLDNCFIDKSVSESVRNLFGAVKFKFRNYFGNYVYNQHMIEDIENGNSYHENRYRAIAKSQYNSRYVSNVIRANDYKYTRKDGVTQFSFCLAK